MAGFKILQNTAVQGDVQQTDIIPIARGSGALSNVVISALVTFLKAGTGGIGAFFLQAANNLSDLANAATARTNLGVQPTVAPSFTGGLTASGGINVTGGAVVAGGISITGGVGQTGGTVQNVDALAALNIDFSAADVHTKSISTNSTFTYSGITAAKSMASLLDLTISSAAIPTFPAATKWSNGSQPTLGNGRHLIGLVTDDGGTTVIGVLCATAIA